MYITFMEDHFITGDLVGRALPGETAKSARSRPGSELVSEAGAGAEDGGAEVWVPVLGAGGLLARGLVAEGEPLVEGGPGPGRGLSAAAVSIRSTQDCATIAREESGVLRPCHSGLSSVTESPGVPRWPPRWP